MPNTTRRSSLAGEVFVTRQDQSWDYQPSRRVLKVGPPKHGKLMTGIGPMAKALRTGDARISIAGTDNVAGRPATVLEIAGTNQTPTGSIKMWIDNATGAQLRTEVYDESGQMQSVSYFTQIAFGPTFPSGTFDQPVVAQGTRTETEQPRKQLTHFPSDAEAGFHVLQPSYLPSGYVFQSSSIFQVNGKPAVGLMYNSGLTILSVFESPTPQRSQNRPEQVLHPRAGTVILKTNGMQFAAIGTLSDDELLSVLHGLH